MTSTDSSTDGVANVWDHVADVYDQGVPFFGVLGRRLVDAIDPRPGDVVLDIATGRGACLFPTADRIGATGRVIGIDLSPAMVALTATEIAERHIINAAVLTADAQRLPSPDRSFDMVLCSQSIGQFPEPIAALRQSHRVLRPGGRLGIQRDTAPDPRWAFTTKILEEFADVRATESTRTFDVATLAAQAGFVNVERFEHPLELVFPDRVAWRDWAWTIGSGRRHLEPLPEHIRLKYFDRVFDCMDSVRTSAGYRMVLTIETVLAHRWGPASPVGVDSSSTHFSEELPGVSFESRQRPPLVYPGLQPGATRSPLAADHCPPGMSDRRLGA